MKIYFTTLQAALDAMDELGRFFVVVLDRQTDVFELTLTEI